MGTRTQEVMDGGPCFGLLLIMSSVQNSLILPGPLVTARDYLETMRRASKTGLKLTPCLLMFYLHVFY